MTHLNKAFVLIVAVSVCLGLGLVACGGKKKKKKDYKGSDFPAAVLHDLKAAGLQSSSFQQINPAPYGAQICAEGQVEGLAVLVCAYDAPDKAKGAKSRLLGYAQGAVTGLVRTRGDLAIVVADPDKMDLRGKRIAKLVKAFKK